MRPRLGRPALPRHGDTRVRSVPRQPQRTLHPHVLPSELSPAARETLEGSNPGALQLELTPLAEEEVKALLGALELSDALPPESHEGLARALSRATGGNPMFVLETVKSLLESGQLSGSVPAQLPQSDKVAAVIGKRLGALRPATLNLARVAAVAGTDFTSELAAAVLEQGVTDLGDALTELDRAQVLRGSAFAHDLILEATLSDMPALLRRLLHGRVAVQLEALGAAPATRARHYLGAGAAAKAAPLLLQAAETSRRNAHFVEAAQALEQAATLLADLGQPEAAFDARATRTELLVKIDTQAALPELDELSLLARTPTEQLRTLNLRCHQLTFSGDAPRLETLARQGLEQAKNSADEAAFTFHLGHALWLQNRAAAALPFLERARALQRDQDGPSVETTVILGGVLFEVGRFADSEAMLEEAEAHYRNHGHDLGRANVLNERAINALKEGYPGRAQTHLLEAERIFARTTGAGYDYVDVLHALAVCWACLADERRCLGTLEQAKALGEQGHTGFSGALHLSFGSFYSRMGAFEEAEASFRVALEWPGLPVYQRPRALRGLAGVYIQTGRDPAGLLAEAETLLRDAGNPVHDVCALLALKAQWAKADEALEFATQAHHLALTHGFKGEALSTLLRTAQALLELGRANEALSAVEEAGALLEETGLLNYRSELLLVRYWGQGALDEAAARGTLTTALAWLQEISERVPDAYRKGFLERNPIHRALLDEGALLGLERPTP